MNKIKNILFLAIVGFLMASCVTARKVNYMQEPDKQIPSYADTLDFEDYQLRIGDRLLVYVYSMDKQIMQLYNSGMRGGLGYMRSLANQQNSGNYNSSSMDLYTYLVDEDGNIDYPTIGKVHVRGLTTREVKYRLEEELSSLLKDMPGFSTISCEVNIVTRTFSVIGAQSGRYVINKEKMTIFEALALAGDLGEFNSRKEVKLIREKEGVTTVKTFDVRSKDIINSEYYYIEPNDIIYIRKIPGYSFGVNSASTVLSVTAATISFGVLVYTVVATGINHVNKHYPKSGTSSSSGTSTKGGAQ